MTVLFDGRASIIGAGPWNTSVIGPWEETSWWAPDNVATPARAPRRCTLVPDPLGIKGQVLRSALLNADGAALAGLPTSRRSELSQTGVLQAAGSTYWTKTDTLIQSPWPPELNPGIASTPTTFWQIHDTLDAGDTGRGPVFEFLVDHDEWILESRSNLSAASFVGSVSGTVLTVTTMVGGALVVGQKLVGAGVTAGTTIASFGTGNGTNNGGTYNLSASSTVGGGTAMTSADETSVLRKIVSGPVSEILDEWQSWVVKITWSFLPGAGSITVWRNGRRIFEETGQKNCSRDALGGFTTVGTYCPVNWPTVNVVDRVSYSTGMVIGDAAETFLSFTGAAELERVTPVRMAAA